MNRRDFQRRLAAFTALAMLPLPLPAAPRPRLIKPRRLMPGALVGLVMPSGVSDDAHIEKCFRQLESQGFRVKPGRHIRAAWGGYAGRVAERVADLHAMFADREVDALWVGRGGSGASALLPHLDYALIRRNAKILIGYSDVTALHLALYRRAGLVTFHGPVASSTLSDYSVTQMQAVLMHPREETVIHMSVENEQRAATDAAFALRTVRKGIAEGRLVGGNLSVLAALVGTPYGAELAGHLLYLEEVGEQPYRVDRMLTQLDQSQGLARAAGTILGTFTRGRVVDGDRSLRMEEVVDAHFAGLDAPSVYGFSFGHIGNQFTLPVGIRARLDTEARTLTLLEPAVTG